MIATMIGMWGVRIPIAFVTGLLADDGCLLCLAGDDRRLDGPDGADAVAISVGAMENYSGIPFIDDMNSLSFVRRPCIPAA